MPDWTQQWLNPNAPRLNPLGSLVAVLTGRPAVRLTIPKQFSLVLRGKRLGGERGADAFDEIVVRFTGTAEVEDARS
jgi:hypothetical protein